MRVTSMRVQNFRSIEDSGELELDSINVLLGPNNAGKSSLIRALALFQAGLPHSPEDVRMGAQAAEVKLGVTGLPGAMTQLLGTDGPVGDGTVSAVLNNGGGLTLETSAPRAGRGHGQFPGTEPNHFLVPYFSKRKVPTYDLQINRTQTATVGPDLSNLTAKVARVAEPSFPGSARYRDACQELLGFVVTVVPGPNGQEPGVYVPTGESIPITRMGEGVPNIVGLLADLAIAEGKFFLMEEPENDVHPRALKALLSLVVDSAERNQFLVSTHSNVVARHLGAATGSTLHYVDSEPGVLPPIASCRAVSDDPAERIAVLADLGYELYDFHLWDGWLILEESSAERIIRDHLVPWFAPRLSRVRTIAVGGTGNVEPAFADFHRLFLFTHLEALYRNRAWVLVDGDESGIQTVERLQERYGATWDRSHFRTFTEPAFEKYYPDHFSDAVEAVLDQPSGQHRQEAKQRLLEELIDWVESDPDAARQELEQSAGEVINVLREIEQTLFAPS